MKLTLQTQITNLGCIGSLYDDKMNLICVTIEKQYIGNAQDISCVHPGLYDFLPRHSPSQGDTYYLSNPDLGVTLNEPGGRTYIQWDVANKESQLLGCIAGGLRFGVMDGEWCVFDSGKAKDKLMRILNGENHQLEIFRH